MLRGDTRDVHVDIMSCFTQQDQTARLSIIIDKELKEFIVPCSLIKRDTDMESEDFESYTPLYDIDVCMKASRVIKIYFNPTKHQKIGKNI